MSRLRLAAWHAVAIALLMFVPSALLLRTSFRALPAAAVPQALATVAGYLAFALWLHIASDRDGRVGFGTVIAGAVVCFGGSFSVLWLRSDLAHSRALLLFGAVAGGVLAWLPYARGRARGAIVGTGAVAAVAALVVAVVLMQRTRSTASDVSGARRVYGEAHPLQVSYFKAMADNPAGSRGGGIIRHEKGFLLVDGLGKFYHLDWTAKNDSLVSRPLALELPMDREVFRADRRNATLGRRLRVTGIIEDTTVAPHAIYVAHQVWSHDRQCFTVRVSTTNVDLTPRGTPSTAQWRSVYETKPCVEPRYGFDDLEIGGRLAWETGHHLLLTTGDHGFHGRYGDTLSQERDGDYGKILRLDVHGGAKIITVGHRNPQGLVVSRDGTIWETEHGPQGGDEINIIREGSNYGWPLVTYGSEYGRDEWPINSDSLNHGSFAEPAFVFMPSIGIANIIEIEGKEFPRWKGDLLIASLAKQSVYRVRKRGEHIIYVKPIKVEPRVRDLAEGSDGRIAIWTDEGSVLTLSRGRWPITGAEVYARCAPCHEMDPGTVLPAAPSLRGAVGREVASQRNFRYSDALRQVSGKWTRERLNTFLSSPGTMAPGSPMAPWAVPDSLERRVLLDYLATLH